MNGFVLVDMTSGTSLVSMAMVPGFGIPGVCGDGTDDKTASASLAALAFSITLNAWHAVHGDTEDGSLQRHATEDVLAYLKESTAPFGDASTSASRKRLDANAAPLQTFVSVDLNCTLALYLHPRVPLLCVASCSSGTSTIGLAVTEAVTHLFISSGHAAGYFSGGDGVLRPNKYKRLMSAAVKDAYHHALTNNVRWMCHDQFVCRGVGHIAGWELCVLTTRSSEPLHKAMTLGASCANGGLMSYALSGGAPGVVRSGAADDGGADDEQSLTDVQTSLSVGTSSGGRWGRKKQRRSSGSASTLNVPSSGEASVAAGVEQPLQPDMSGLEANRPQRFQDMIDTLRLVLTHRQLVPSGTEGLPVVSSVVLNDGASGHFSVLFFAREGDTSILLTLYYPQSAPLAAPQLPSLFCATHASWAHAQFPLWCRIFRFSRDHRLRTFADS